MTAVIALVPAARDPRDVVPALAALAAALAARGRPCRIALAAAPDDPAAGLLAAFAPTEAAPELAEAIAAAAGPGTVLALGEPPGAALRIVLADAARGLPRPWPLGPGAMARRRLLRGAGLVMLTGPAGAAGPPLPPGPPVLRAVPVLLETGMDWAGTRLMLAARADALPGLARLVAAAGATVAGTAPLDPQGPIAPALVSRIAAEARTRRARLAVPEPDAIRLPAALRREALALPVRLTLPDPAPLDAALGAAGLG